MNDFIVTVRDGSSSYFYSYVAPSYSEVAMTIPPADIDDRSYVITCPPGFVPQKDTIKTEDLPF